MINFDDAPRRSRGQDLPPRPDDAPDATEEQARNLWKLLVEGSLKGHRLRVGNTLRRGGQRGSAGSNAEFEFVEGQVPVSTGSGRRRSSFDPRRYNLKIVADAMRGEKARAIALDNLRFVMDETTGKLYLPWATKEGEARSHNAIPRDLRRYAKDALYTTSGGNTGVRHFYPPGYGPLDDEDAPESRQPKAPVSELRGERGKKRLQDWWDAGGGTPGVTARLRDFSENHWKRLSFAEAEEKRSLFITFELPDYLAEKYPSRAKANDGVKATDDSKPHVTILYCGKQTAAAAEKARKAAVEVLKDADSIEIQGSGVDHFTGCEDEGKTDAVYTPITGGVTKLTELREKLAKALRDAGVEWTDTHPEYKPHVTIKYVPKGDADTVDPIEPWTAHVHCLHVNHGDSHRPVYLKQSFKVPFSESASGGQQFRHPQQAFGIRSIPPTASAYIDRLRQWRTPGSDVEPPDMPAYELLDKGKMPDGSPIIDMIRRGVLAGSYNGNPQATHAPNRLRRVPHGGLDYDPSEMSDRVPTDAEKREIVGPNVWDERMVRGVVNGKPLAATGSLLQDYELERYEPPVKKQSKRRPNPFLAGLNLGVPHGMLERHNLRYPNHPAQQEASVNVPGSATDLRTRLLEMELNDPSVPHDALARSREAWRWSPNPGVGSASYLSPTDEYASEYGVAQGSSDISKALAQRTGDAYGTPDEIDAMALFRALAAKHGTSPHGSMAAQIGDTIRRNISRHRFARQPQQFGRSMGYAVDVPEQAFARETHPMLQMAIDRSLQRPHRSSMPPEIGHPRSPLEYTGAGPVVVRSAPQDLTPEAFGPGNHIVTGEMPISRRRPNFQPIREPRFNPDAAHDEVVRLMLGRLPRRRYNGKPDEPWVVRANDEWNSDPTTFQRYQQAFAVDDDPNSPRRVWQTPPVVKPQAPQKPAAPSKPEGQDIQNARVLANHYARPAIQPSTPKEPGFGKPSARQGEGLSEDWIKNFVKRGDDQSNEFAPPWMRGAGYDAPWNRGRGPENIGENLFPIAPTPRMIDDRQPSLAPYRSGSRLDGGYLPRVRSVVNRAAIGGQPRSLGSVLGGAARGAWRGGTSGLGTSLGNIGLGLAGTLLGLGTQNLGTIGHGLLGIGSGALGIAGTPLRAVGGAGLGAAGYDPASWSTKRWGYKPWKVQQRQPEDDQEAPWANAPERKFSRQSQGFSILRPNETGAGRGLGSAYPRVSTGRYGETNVEYDPTIKPIERETPATNWLSLLNAARAGYHNYIGANTIDAEREYSNRVGDDDQTEPWGMRNDERRYDWTLKSMHDGYKAFPGILTSPLTLAGIQREGRGPGRGGGPRFSRHDHEFAAPGGAPNRVMFPSDDGSAQPGQYANAGLQTQQMRSVFGPQSSLQTTRPPFTQAAQAGGTILVTPTGGIMGVVVPPRTIPVSPTTMQPIRPQPSTRWEKPRQFARHDHEFSASGVAGQFAPNVPAMPRMNRQTFNPQPPQQEPIVDWLQALRGTGAPRPMPQQQIQRPRPKPRPSAAEEFWPRVMPFARRPQQGFSILRPYETSGGGKFPGRGIGSPYPRIVNGNVEYDPTIRPIEAGNIERNGDELRITRPQNEKRISVPVGAQIRNGITYFDPSDRIEGTPTDIQIEGAPWRPETARIYDDGGDGGEIEQLDPRRDRETDDSALRELYEWRRKARLRANQQPKSLWAGEQLPQSLDGDRVETYRKRENELSMGPEDSATGEMLRSLAKLENRKFIVNNDGFTIPHPEGDADTHPLGKAGIIQRPRHWKLGRSRLDQSPLSQEQLKVLHGFNPMYLSADVAVGDPEWRRLANIASSTYRPRTKGALDDRHYVQYGRMPSAEQDFSILRPDETGKGRGLGSVYPRVSTGRYGETNVEYNPNETWRKLGEGIGYRDGEELEPWSDRRMEDRARVRDSSLMFPTDPLNDPRDFIGEFNSNHVNRVETQKQLSRHLRAMAAEREMGGNMVMPGLYSGMDPLSIAGIRRPGRGPGRGGGPRFMAQHSFSIGASAPSATTLNHFHPSIRRSTKRRMFEVC